MPTTKITRFNALRQGVLSRNTVLPRESVDEYRALVSARAAEHMPQGPARSHRETSKVALVHVDAADQSECVLDAIRATTAATEDGRAGRAIFGASGGSSRFADRENL